MRAIGSREWEPKQPTSTNVVFTHEDHEWVERVDREALALALAEGEARARLGTSRHTCIRTDIHPTNVVHDSITQAGPMAHQFSRTYLRHLYRKQTGYSEAEAMAKLEDDDEDDDQA